MNLRDKIEQIILDASSEGVAADAILAALPGMG